MGKSRCSVIWSESREDFQDRVNRCNSIADILRSFGFSIGSANYRTVHKRIQEDRIDVSHIPLGLDSNKGRVIDGTRVHSQQYLFSGSNISSNNLKKKLLRDGLLKNECSECGNPGVWKEKSLILQLDHINGIRNDNRLENLRILCPNCHTQTITYSGRNRASKCVDCGINISRRSSSRCRSCSVSSLSDSRPVKFQVTKEELELLIWTKPASQIAKDFSVSDKAVEKKCKKFGITKPPRGYWQKKKAIP
jgi:5-methylcytosine-specific restriction endonuclease McrA